MKTGSFMLVTMVFQTLYFFVDLYFVGRLGKEAIVGVGIAGNLTFIVLAVTQMLAVGTTTLISHASGRKDLARAQMVLNQSVMLAGIIGVVFLVIITALRSAYVNALSPDLASAQATWASGSGISTDSYGTKMASSSVRWMSPSSSRRATSVWTFE